MNIKSELKTTLTLAVPIIISQVGQLMYGIMDTAMVGKLGAVPLSASAFVNAVFNIPFVFLAGVTSAVSVLISKDYGAKNYKKIGDILWTSFIMVGLLSVLLILGLEILGFNLHVFQQPQEVLDACYDYYRTIIWSILPFVLFFVLKHFSEAVSRPALPTKILLGGLLLNFILNYTFIYGHFGFKSYGLYGAGIATLIARWVCVLVMALCIIRSQKFKMYFHENFSLKIQTSYALEMFKIGLPSGFQYLFEVMAFAGAGIMMGWLGTIELAAHQISLQIAALTFMFALGLSFATAVRIGQLYGQQNYLGLRLVGIGSFIFIGLLLAFFGTVILVLRNWLPTLFIDDVAVITLSSQLFIIVFFFQIFDGTQAIGVSALRALSDVKIPTLITFLSYWVMAIPLGYFLGFKTDLRHLGIWSSLGVGLAIASIFLIWRFLNLTKKLIEENRI